MNGPTSGKKPRVGSRPSDSMRKHRVKPTVTDKPSDGDKKPPKRKKPASPGPVTRRPGNSDGS